MNKIRIVFFVFNLLFVSIAYGQAEKNVSPMKMGTKLTPADIVFLNVVLAEVRDHRVDSTVRDHRKDSIQVRDHRSTTAIVDDVPYTPGKILTGGEARNITTTIASFQKIYKAPLPISGAKYYYESYHYCDAEGNCNWYKCWFSR